MDEETRKDALDGLRQGFQAKLAKIYDNLSSPGEPRAEERFRDGVRRAIKAYERAREMLSE